MNNNNNNNYKTLKVTGIMDILFGIVMCSVGFYGLDEISDRLFKSEEAEFYSTICVWLGVVCIISGILFVIAANSQEKKALQDMYNHVNHMHQHNVYESQITNYKICSNCGDTNDIKANYCRNCSNKLDNNKIVSRGQNCWVCPKCGNVNQNYVGTCGCGEVKP